MHIKEKIILSARVLEVIVISTITFLCVLIKDPLRTIKDLKEWGQEEY